uniref:Uncharacterized protein n=1 Tax=viral metagenome TaxID=1070528 RepID=A0A6M3L040_9ZZZZ
MNINKKACRRWMLDYARRTRHHKFTRVSNETFLVLDLKLRNTMRDIVDKHPSRGKTISA